MPVQGVEGLGLQVTTQGQVGRMGHDVGTSINTVHLHSLQRVIARPYVKSININLPS